MDDPILQKFLVDFGYVTETQIANFEGVQASTIAQRRVRGKMPPHRKVSNTILYRTDEYAETVEAPVKEGGSGHPVPRPSASSDLLGGAA